MGGSTYVLRRRMMQSFPRRREILELTSLILHFTIRLTHIVMAFIVTSPLPVLQSNALLYAISCLLVTRILASTSLCYIQWL